jgi:hypothetical protein
VDSWERWRGVRSSRQADRTTLAAEAPPSRGRLSVRRRGARCGFRRVGVTSGRQRMHIARMSPAVRTNCGFGASERCAEPRNPKNDCAQPREPERRPIEEGEHRAMRRPHCENSHDDMNQGAVGVIDPRCLPANARLLGTVQPDHSHLGFTRTRGEYSSRTVPDLGLGQVRRVRRALPSSFELLQDA